MNLVSLQYQGEVITYPRKSSYYSPSRTYPEYPWDKSTVDLALREGTIQGYNDVYDMVRECFITAGLDHEHIGLKNWNPLGQYIHKDDTVLLKPNWVENKNKNPEVNDDLQCLVTNPSVVRAVLDYVIIALGNSGRIIIADAPMQGCDLDEVFRIAGYNELFTFYKDQGIDIDVYDLRKYSVETKYRGVFMPPKLTNNGLTSTTVDLSSASMHAEKDGQKPKYKVEDYEQIQTASYHSEGKHIYEVNLLPLQADVIINMPKPKTHRLAGITGACKNFVGITYEKASLPHRIDSDKQVAGGDAYDKKSNWKLLMSIFNEKRTYHSRAGHVYTCKFYDLLMKSCYVMGAITSRDKYRIGSWYGNDTIWRTAVDLNNVMLHADKHGNLMPDRQRTIITVGDMIIGGQKNGPVGPTPKPLGAILFSDNNLLFDRVVCEIMGFAYEKFPLFVHDAVPEVFGYKSHTEVGNEVVKSNLMGINGKRVNEMELPQEWWFEAHPCWIGHIEKKPKEVKQQI